MMYVLARLRFCAVLRVVTGYFWLFVDSWVVVGCFSLFFPGSGMAVLGNTVSSLLEHTVHYMAVF